jgi:predicted NAD/FAD-binding protein
MSKRIAIVGAGISGLGAAWMLKESGFDVTVFESRSAPGGQMEWFDLNRDGENIRFDMYTACLADSPNMRALADHWNLRVNEFNYGLYYSKGPYSWGNYKSSDFLLAHRDECERFIQILRELYEEDASLEALSLTVKDFLDRYEFSTEFGDHIFCPMLATVLDFSANEFYGFSMAMFIEVFGAGIFTFFNMPKMYRFQNGISDPVQSLAAALDGCMKLSTGVDKITRGPDSVQVLDSTGVLHHFDEIILSSNFRQNMAMLSDATREEMNIFEGLCYETLHVVIHSDKEVWQSPGADDERLVVMVKGKTVSNPVVQYGQAFSMHDTVLISGVTGPENAGIASEKIIGERFYERESMTIDSSIAKGHVRYIQGVNRTWYCGLSTVPGMSECCLVSGFVIAEKLGATYPFNHNEDAKYVFNNMRQFMFGSIPSLRMLRRPAETSQGV